MRGLVERSARHAGWVVGLWGLAVAGAALSLGQLPIDAMPDVTNVQVGVVTPAPALSPAEVEQYITAPVELAMNGLPKVTQIRSTSRAGVSLVTVVFRDEVDLYWARQQVAERMREAEANIPVGTGRPGLTPLSSALGEVVQFTLRSPKRSPTELRTLLDWDMSYPLRQVPGVVEVNAMGGAVKQYQVIARPRRLAALKLSIQSLQEALRANNVNVGSGTLEMDMEQLVIRGEGQLGSLEDIGNIAISADADGTPILIKHVAQVTLGSSPRFGSVTQAGHGPVVAGSVLMLVGANSREVTEKVKHKLAELQKTLPEDVVISTTYDRTEFIDRTLGTIFTNLLEAALGVIAVLFVMLGSLAPALIAASAIPAAMLMTTLAMRPLGISGNIMSLGAIDFGLLVDGAIIMCEVALASLAWPGAGGGPSLANQVGERMGRAARAVVFSLGIILLVYLPLMALEGSEGRMFRPMAVTIALALGFALAYTLTAVPALGALCLRPHAHPGRFWPALEAAYGRALGRLLPRPRPLLAAALGLVVAAAGVGRGLGAEFVPRIDEGELSLEVRRLPSVALSLAEHLGEAIEQVLMGLPEVSQVVTRTGRAEVATDPVGPEEAKVMVKLAGRDRWPARLTLDQLGDKVKAAIEAQVPASFVAVSQPIEDTVNDMIAGSRADVAIKVFGPDLGVLKATADEVARAVAPVAGTGDLRVQRVLGLPLLNIKPDRERLARHGLNIVDVLEVVEACRLGQTVGRVFEGERRFDLVLLYPPHEASPEGIGALSVGTPRGQLLPLGSLAELAVVEGPAAILREDLTRRVMVEVNVRERDLVGWVGEAKARVEKLQLPAGVRVAWGGQFENFQRARARLGMVVPAVVAVILGMLMGMFGRLRQALAVFASVGLAAVGGVGLLWARSLPFSIPAAVGFIAVGGVSVLNGVVLASRIDQARAEGHDGPAAASLGAVRALRPMLTTALVAVVGFLPMSLGQRTGSEVQRPLAAVVIGGVVSSTALMLWVLPALLCRRQAPRRAAR